MQPQLFGGLGDVSLVFCEDEFYVFVLVFVEGFDAVGFIFGFEFGVEGGFDDVGAHRFLQVIGGT